MLRLHMERKELPSLSDFIDLSYLSHQHFHPDITDKLFILVAVAKSKDLAGINSLSSEGGGYLLKQRARLLLTNTYFQVQYGAFKSLILAVFT